jgi:hypothetical protein
MAKLSIVSANCDQFSCQEYCIVVLNGMAIVKTKITRKKLTRSDNTNKKQLPRLSGSGIVFVFYGCWLTSTSGPIIS